MSPLLRPFRAFPPSNISRFAYYRYSTTTQSKHSLNLFEKGDLVPYLVPMANDSNVVKLGTIEMVKDDALQINEEWIDIHSNRLDPQQLFKRWDHKRLFKLQMTADSIRCGTKYWNIHQDEIKLIKSLITLKPTTSLQDEETLIKTRKFLDDHEQKLESAVDEEWMDISSRSISLVQTQRESGKEVEILAFGSVFGHDIGTRIIELIWSPIHCFKAYQETKQNPIPLLNVLWHNACGRYDIVNIDDQDS